MALDPSSEGAFSGRINAPDANYPYGSGVDESAPGAYDGTPYTARLLNDIWGALQGLLQRAGLTPSGNPDTAVASQYIDAINGLVKTPTLGRFGLDMSTDAAGGQINIGPGAAKDATDVRDIYTPTSIGKTLAAWADGGTPGAPVGGLAAGVPLAVGWYRVFMLGRPDGTANAGVDTSPTAANLLADPNVVAAGYTLFRHRGWVYFDGAAMRPMVQREYNRWEWVTRQIDFIAAPPLSTTGAAVSVAAPPGCDAVVAAGALQNAGPVLYLPPEFILVTALDQANIAPGPSAYDILLTSMSGGGISARADSTNKRVRVDGTSQLRYRSSSSSGGAGGNLTFSIESTGWVDPEA